MEILRNSIQPIYQQLKNLLIEKIRTGEYAPGSMLMTEDQLCEAFEISRFPVRQALGELVEEGYLVRVRGKGTFVNEVVPEPPSFKQRNKMLGLVMSSLTIGFNRQVFEGFERTARIKGYLCACHNTDLRPEEEVECIKRMVEAGIEGIGVFQVAESRINELEGELKQQKVHLAFIDISPGFPESDLITSDNYGGGYVAARHLFMQGYKQMIYVYPEMENSTVQERMKGYLKAIEDFGGKALGYNDVFGEVAADSISHSKHKSIRGICFDAFAEALSKLKSKLPFGIFAVNDFIAIECMKIVEASGLVIGQDVGIVGFDNIPESSYAVPVPLTTVAQNGLLIGQNAAEALIDKLEGRETRVIKTTIPTQLVVRESCGERMNPGRE